MLTYAHWITQALLTVAVFCAVYRVFRGPSVLDRVISVDVILIIVSSMLITDMVARNHQDFILFVVATAVIGFLGAVAIARYVAVRRSEEPGGGVSDQTGALPQVTPDGSGTVGAQAETEAAGVGGSAAPQRVPATGTSAGASDGASAGVPADQGQAPYAASPSRVGGMDPVDPHGGTSVPRVYGEDEDPATSWFRELTSSGFTPRRRRAAGAAEEAEDAEDVARRPGEESDPPGETPEPTPGEEGR